MFEDIIECLNTVEKIAIFPHVSMDGDAFGSSLALAFALEKIGKSPKIILEEDVSDTYSFLETVEFLQDYRVDKNSDYQLAIALDSGDIGRLGERVELFKSVGKTVNIDHHRTNTKFADYNYVDKNASSVGEIMYLLIKEMSIELDKNISNSIYTSIVADTGGFKYSSTSADTHRIAADLIEHGVDVADVSKKIFENVSMDKLKLKGIAINRVALFGGGKVSILDMTDMTIKDSIYKDDDFDGLIDIVRSIKGVEVAGMFKIRENGELKVSLRSNYYVNVADIAESYFGGGHVRAAGFTIKENIEEKKKEIIERIIKNL